MKHNINAAILALIALLSLAGCSNTATADSGTIEETTAATTDTIVEEVEPVYDFPSLPSEEELLMGYRNLVSDRLDCESFFSEEERIFLTEAGYHFRNDVCISKYDSFYDEISLNLYPVLYNDDKGNVYMVYTGESGSVWQEVVLQKTNMSGLSDYIGYAHTSETDAIIRENHSYAVTYNTTTGKVSFWMFGELQKEYTVPEGSVYTGFSDWEGYIFRSGTDVYALREDIANPYQSTEEIYLIARNVQQVIMANYMAGSDDWSQPLFLMEDGTLKVYCYWYGDSEVPADDISHLQDVRYEGGYLRYQ